MSALWKNKWMHSVHCGKNEWMHAWSMSTWGNDCVFFFNWTYLPCKLFIFGPRIGQIRDKHHRQTTYCGVAQEILSSWHVAGIYNGTSASVKSDQLVRENAFSTTWLTITNKGHQVDSLDGSLRSRPLMCWLPANIDLPQGRWRIHTLPLFSRQPVLQEWHPTWL